MATFKCYFSTHIDQESHPQITNKQSAIEIAATLTTNHIGGFDWDDECKTLNFTEYVYIEADCEEDLEGMEEKPQIKGAEFSGATKLCKPK